MPSGLIGCTVVIHPPSKEIFRHPRLPPAEPGLPRRAHGRELREQRPRTVALRAITVLPAFSFDERWIVYHHWVQADDWQAMGYPSQSDPGFQALLGSATANLFLLDLTTGTSRRITSMAPGQEALFPHFRSDGWIYFIVKGATAGEVIAASDAALVFGP